MAEITASDSRTKHRGLSKLANHRSTRVDLTPMVDLGFLLITFFVFTSSMAQPKAMNLNEPHEGEPRPVKASHTMTLLPAKNHEVYYYHGVLNQSEMKSQMKRAVFHMLRSLIVAKKKASDPEYLMFIIKSAEGSTFGDHMKLLDEMTICDIKSGHYAEVEISEAEAEILGAKSAF